MQFASRFSQRLVLQGHSLGCDRIVQFVLSKRGTQDIILLSPCDSYALQAKWIAPETVEEQIARLKAKPRPVEGLDWLPGREYGVRQSREWTYSIPITRAALLSIMEGPPFRLFNISEPAAFKLSQRAVIYIGGKDALQTSSRDAMFEYFRERIPDLTEVCVADGDHMLADCEEAVARKVIGWVGLSGRPDESSTVG